MRAAYPQLRAEFARARARFSFLRSHVGSRLFPPLIAYDRLSGVYADTDPVIDILALRQLRIDIVRDWRIWCRLHFPQRPLSDVDEQDLCRFLQPLTSPDLFFAAYPGLQLYRPVAVIPVTDRERQPWTDLSALLRELADQQAPAGVLLVAGSGGGKTVAMWKAFFDTVCRPLNRHWPPHKAEASQAPSPGDPPPILHDFVSCWLDVGAETPLLRRVREEIANRPLEAERIRADYRDALTETYLFDLVAVAAGWLAPADVETLAQLDRKSVV